MIYEVYCDESRQQLFTDAQLTDGQYAVIGSLWIDANDRQSLKNEIQRVRETHGVYAELKWKKISPSRLDLYRDLVRLFFAEAMKFRCIVLPASQLDSGTFHQSDEELMFYKFYYQLLHHWIARPHSYRVFLDVKTNRVHGRVSTLENVLCNANPGCQITVQALPSDELVLLQLADVLIGAVGYRLHALDTSGAKLAVVEEIESHIGHPIRGTPRSTSKFNVFRFHPRPR